MGLLRGEVLEQVGGIGVVGEDHGEEVGHAFLPGPGREPGEECLAEPLAAPMIGDHDRHLGLAVPVRMGADVPRHPDQVTFVGVDCRQRLVMVVIDLGQVGEVGFAQSHHRSEEPLETGLGAQPFETGGELLLVGRPDRPDQHLDARAKHRHFRFTHGSISPCRIA